VCFVLLYAFFFAACVCYVRVFVVVVVVRNFFVQ